MLKRILTLLIAVSMATSFAVFTAGSSQPDQAKSLWMADGEKDKIIVISDLHLGIDDEYAETVENRQTLIDFLKQTCATKDVRELVIAGDFLDAWYLPVYYPSYSDESAFYKGVIANNQGVFDELNNIIKAGIKLVYVPGNHDMTLQSAILTEALPGIVQASDSQGMGAYYTGDRNEIVIEHAHRYDVFSAPDTVSNAELCGNDESILPAGYFYARYAATWVLEGRPSVPKELPVVTHVPDASDVDQYGAFLYYSVLKSVSERMTIWEDLNASIFDIHFAGFDDAYTYLDFYPAEQSDGSISAPVLFKNLQRTWEERQTLNKVNVHNSFIEAVAGTIEEVSHEENKTFYLNLAKTQYLENSNENVDVVVFGHTHIPEYHVVSGEKIYVNDGTLVDNNTDDPSSTCTFSVITTGEKDSVSLYHYEKTGDIVDIGTDLAKKDGASSASRGA